MNQLSSGDTLRADVAELRHEMRLGFARIDSKFEATIATLRGEMKEQTSRLVLWSFVFWVGAVGAVATLAGVLKG